MSITDIAHTLLEEQLMASNKIYEKAFTAGHKAGYSLGYKEATADALAVVAEALDGLPKPQGG